MVEKMEQEARRVWPTHKTELAFYVNNLDLGMHTSTREQLKGLDMIAVVTSMDGIMNRIGQENLLTLEESKHENLVLCNRLPFMLSHFLHAFPTSYYHLLCHNRFHTFYSYTHAAIPFACTPCCI